MRSNWPSLCLPHCRLKPCSEIKSNTVSMGFKQFPAMSTIIACHMPASNARKMAHSWHCTKMIHLMMHSEALCRATHAEITLCIYDSACKQCIYIYIIIYNYI